MKINKRLVVLSLMFGLASCGSDDPEASNPSSLAGEVETTLEILSSDQSCGESPLIGDWVLDTAEGNPNGLPTPSALPGEGSPNPDGGFGAFTIDSSCAIKSQVCNRAWDFTVTVNSSGADVFISEQGLLDDGLDDIFGCLPSGDDFEQVVACGLRLYDDGSMVVDCTESSKWPDYVQVFRRL